MSTSDWALVISLFSLVIALASFVWNVWSKFIFPRPKVAVSFMLMQVWGSEPLQRFLTINFTNFGPGEVTIDLAVARSRRRFMRKRPGLGMLNPLNHLNRPDDPTGPFAGGLPKKLSVGEEHTLYFPYAADVFVREPLVTVGVHDTFRRSHWAPKADFAKVLRRHLKDFPNVRDETIDTHHGQSGVGRLPLIDDE